MKDHMIVLNQQIYGFTIFKDSSDISSKNFRMVCPLTATACSGANKLSWSSLTPLDYLQAQVKLE